MLLTRTLPRLAVLALAVLLMFGSLGRTAEAAIITVTNLDNSGAGSLRDVIASAAAGDTIDLSGAYRHDILDHRRACDCAGPDHPGAWRRRAYD